MIGWIKKKARYLKDKFKLMQEVQPEKFHKMAEELTELADACAQVCPSESEILLQIERVKIEMKQLKELTTKPEFKRLSIQRRLELKESMIQSREQILNSVQTVPTQTKFLQ